MKINDRFNRQYIKNMNIDIGYNQEGSLSSFFYNRISLPAIVLYNGTITWIIDAHSGTKHRVDGPARTFINGEMMFFINNKNMNILEFMMEKIV